MDEYAEFDKSVQKLHKKRQEIHILIAVTPNSV